uniref:Uncharacterized protein n=1 Tax=Lepeophtheirus salmonis TaxID=72036 RepID=A0A0K2UBH5_LEPSM
MEDGSRKRKNGVHIKRDYIQMEPISDLSQSPTELRRVLVLIY